MSSTMPDDPAPDPLFGGGFSPDPILGGGAGGAGQQMSAGTMPDGAGSTTTPPPQQQQPTNHLPWLPVFRFGVDVNKLKDGRELVSNNMKANAGLIVNTAVPITSVLH